MNATTILTQGEGKAREIRGTNYDWGYAYNERQHTQPHAPTTIGDTQFDYDANGNQVKRISPNSTRTLIWDEENRLAQIQDPGKHNLYVYDHSGTRTVKTSKFGQTVYVNGYYTVKNGAIFTKEIKAGSTRIAAYVQYGAPSPVDPEPQSIRFGYYYHPDHLGSTGILTDEAGQVQEIIEYSPFGETLNEQGSTPQLPRYRFTSKELDPATGLYYYGARYYDPRTSVWQSVDPILGKYLPSGNKEQDQSLPGIGGVYNSPNLGLYGYSFLNPIRFIDPTGKSGEDGGKLKLPDQSITKEQLKLATTGKFKRFWKSRWKQNRDPVARTALIGWGESDSVSDATMAEKAGAAFTWGRLKSYISKNKLKITPEQIGKDLALAHAGAVQSDVTNIKGLLSPKQVAGYHHVVFKKYGIPKDLFGGTMRIPFTRRRFSPETYSGLWCAECDTSP